MKILRKSPKADAWTLARALEALSGERAPATLAPAVLRRVGLADTYWKIPSPVGTVFVARGPKGISFVRRTESPSRFEREFRLRLKRTVVPDRSSPPPELVRLVSRLESPGARELPLDLSGLTDFERAVLRKALEIPRGEVRPYGWIAREIGHPDAVRAAGTALARNPIPLVIPCHRVVRSDGTIGGYAFGGRAKHRLLEKEGARPDVLRSLAAEGVRFLGNAERRYFCYPTCGGLDHLIESNRVRFPSAHAALAAGYHPCEDCRPAVAS